jgi:hypothetical protein
MTYFSKGIQLQDVALVDLDGTVCSTKHRDHLIPHWDNYSMACGADPILPVGVNISNALSDHCQVVFVTGRQDIAADETQDWLAREGLQWTGLAMRVPGDHRPNPVIKRDFAQAILLSGAVISVVMDDHPGVIIMMKQLGLPTLHVQFDETPAVFAQDFEAWRRW